MPISELRTRLLDGLLDFAWNEWSQMGVLSAPSRTSQWAQDPEALLVFTLELARRDPRLFEEVLDWLATNESLVSIRRLRRLCTSPQDKQLLDATLGWVAQVRASSQAPKQLARRPSSANLEPLYLGLDAPVPAPDPSFAALGLLRPQTERSQKSSRPDVLAPINFAFRLRLLLGVGTRAETMRFLLTADGPRFTTQAVSRAAGYAKRNVQEALASLHQAAVLDTNGGGVEQWSVADKQSWERLLALPVGFPEQRDWPQLLSALRDMLRWLEQPGLDSLTSYMRDSQARDVLERVHPDFRYAGVPISNKQTAAGALDEIEQLVGHALTFLGVPGHS
jgi:hypothetical protein